MDLNLKGKRVLVTGASKGIGRACVELLAAEGCTVLGTSHADGIRVLGINPGPVATDRLVSLYKQMAQTKLGDANRYEELFKKMSFGRPATSIAQIQPAA